MMLRKRTRSQQKAQHISHLMSDAIHDSYSHSDVFVMEHKNNSIFNIPGLFLGFNRKGSESDSLSSPTSTLDFRVFSSFANPFKFQRSSNEGSQKTWDCSKVGLSIIGSLDDELEQMGKTRPQSESKSIIFGPQFRIRVDSFETPCTQSSDVLFLSGDSPLYQDSFGGDIHSCSPDSVFEKGMNPELSPSQFVRESSKFGKSSATELSSTPASIASISAIEIKCSEDYTCVKIHSPYPKVTHIFGDCILEWHNHDLTDFSTTGEKGTELPMVVDGFKKHTTHPSSDFLSFCHHCKKVLDGEDIYIYRGEKAFCSGSCRSEEILVEEKERASSDAEDSEKTNLGEEFSHRGLFIAI